MIKLPAGASAREDPNVQLGARNVAVNLLAVQRGERVAVLTYRAGALYAVVARAIEEAGAVPVRVEAEPLEIPGASVAEHLARVTPRLAGATATLLVAPTRPEPTLSVAIAKAAEAQRARHLHLLQVDERLLAQAVRADPALLDVVNGRVVAALAPPCDVRVTSETGTDLVLALQPRHPLLSSAGKPAPGASENLPAGHVYTHPAKVNGTLVADRAVFGPKIAIDRATLRRHPVKLQFANGRVTPVNARCLGDGRFAVKLQFANGRVTRLESPDEGVGRTIEAYLGSHANADRVGIVVFPTNYLVKSERGVDRQGLLLPGVAVSLGYASAEVTRAPYDAPVQMVVLGRRQTVSARGRELVAAGRIDPALVEGTDPFR